MLSYKNPIIKGFHPDPSICKVNSDYYLVTSSFEYLPAVPFYHSHDLINWELIGHCLERDSQIDLHGASNSGGIFAPTIRYHQGTFYMITTNILKGNFIVHTKNLEDGFSDPVWIDIQGIDPSLFFEDGKVYVQNAVYAKNKNSYIQQCEIDIETGKLLSSPVEISKGTGGRDVEAPHIYKINGWYYLLCAEGGTREGHMATIQRSKSIYGPYENCPYNPILTNRNQANEPLQAVGHADLFEDTYGQWWVVCLATRPQGQHHLLGRETILLPIEWSEDGWPMVQDRYARMEIEVNHLPDIKQNNDGSFTDLFDQPALRYDYNTIRDFLTDYYTIQDSQLILTGNDTTLSTVASPIFLAVRQSEYHCLFEAKMSVPSLKAKAGLSVYIDNMHHMEIGLNHQNHQVSLYVKKNVEDLQVVSKSIVYQKEDIVLGIEANNEYYIFYYMEDTHHKVILDQTPIKHLMIEVSNSPFTGVYGGMFIEGKGNVSFDWFKYQEV